MAEDYQTTNNVMELDLTNMLVKDLNELLNLNATASSRIAATLFPGGRTAHSRSKIPIDIQLSSIYGIQKQKDLANLIRFVATIIWDETPMTNKKSLEALDRSFQDICSNSAPFGGKVLIMGGDFGQVLPVVRKEFEEFLIRIGDGVEPTKPDDMDAPYMVQRAILTPTNDDVQKLNDMIIDQFLGEENNLLLFDEVEGDNHNLYQQEFLNSIAQSILPPHILKIKKGASLLLLRNLYHRYGLCNGTRLLCRGLFMNMLDVEILTENNAGKRVFLPFVLSIKKFLVRLSFVITINKSQGQTIPNVGIYLPRHSFSHGHLYVALSRGVSQTTTRVLTREGKLKGKDVKLEHCEIFQLCKELRRKNVETCFDIKIRDFEDKWNTWKDEQIISSIGKLDNKVYLPFLQYV
ncbi:uncharacterized protein LOC127103186 [Lathyrus oleraceus]|uniref:uncharacterized protein LOC127103186 n=1 Tax=Pisum sativum TaxID=3888 RepID=UPI0021D2A71C|nr:uncharacterized protein LOC127103186 [Pisum sativum]